jgi:hypothetical protein
MSANSVTLAGRRRAEALMVDACTITRRDKAATGVMDQGTGIYSTVAQLPVYAGKCRLKGGSPIDHVKIAGEQPVTHARFILSLPVDATQYKVDDTVHITASALDPSMVGLLLRVRVIEPGSHITARRLGCEVNEG